MNKNQRLAALLFGLLALAGGATFFYFQYTGGDDGQGAALVGEAPGQGEGE